MARHNYEIVIIGGGPAGLAAGLYAVPARRRTVLLEKGVVGGQIALTEVPGLYVAGDARRNSARQVVSSAGDGTTAAIAGERHVSGNFAPEE